MFIFNKNYQQKFDEKLKERCFNTRKFSNHDEKVFTLMNIWIIVKKLNEHRYLKRKIFTVT